MYGIDGRLWEIDLNAENARDLRDVLAPYLTVSRPHPAKGGPRRRGR